MIFMIIFGVALLVAIAVGAWYLLVGRFYVSTDDAYVAATTAQITPRVDGTIASVPIHDTMHVKKGDVLAIIDPSDAQLAVAQAEANLSLAEQRVTQQFANAASAAAWSPRSGAILSAPRSTISAATRWPPPARSPAMK